MYILSARLKLVALMVIGLVSASFAAANTGPFPDRFTVFESGQVRPLALSPDGKHLYAANTPDNRIEIFAVGNADPSQQVLRHVGSVQVGLEPVAVAARNDHEIWVVNHLSDSISIVDVQPPEQARVVRTLLVGDEPRDIVFAGANGERAFVTTAHRGQNHPLDPQLTTPGVGRADVWVFEADNLGDTLGGTPLTIVTLFADTPRALAVSPDGGTVYAASFQSGNQTASIDGFFVTDGGPNAPDGMGVPGPMTNYQGIPAPDEGIIVKYDGEHWRDEPTGRVWDSLVRFNLPDLDVFAIDANAAVPAQKPGGSYASVGTVLFNMVVNPANGKLYVSNTEARNEVRFEGPGIFGGSTVRGHMHESRITVIDGGAVNPRHLNKHIDYDNCCAATPNAENEKSLAQPMQMVVSADGTTLYVAAFGSSKVGVFQTATLEDDSFVPSAADHIELTGGGPAGLALDEARGRLYVLTRFDNTVSAIDLGNRQEIARRPLYNPEPEHVVAGRPFLYDARLSSGNGEGSCGSCHVFGDLDALGWDLGNPDGDVVLNPGPFTDPSVPFPGAENFHPMKGPKTTQSLRGMDNHGPMHWRGDRNGNNEVPSSAQPDTGLFDERQAFKEFNPAFSGLLGRAEDLTDEQMAAFTDFARELVYPPNPIRQLDNSLTASEARGKEHFFTPAVSNLHPFLPSPLASCNDCHVLDPQANAEYGVDKPGFFGTDGRGVTITAGGQHVKVPHLRNQYQKVGMFGIPEHPAFLPHVDTSHQGDQLRGFGYLHSGGVDTVFRFVSNVFFSDAFVPNGFPFGPEGDAARRDMEAYMLAFDSNLAPIVGQQVTLTKDNGAAVGSRIDLLISRASTETDVAEPHAPECELVVTARTGGQEKGYLYIDGAGVFRQSEHGLPDLTDSELRALAQQGELTYTCAPLGSGLRMALDADLDGCYNVTEIKAESDPRDPSSVPAGCGAP